MLQQSTVLWHCIVFVVRATRQPKCTVTVHLSSHLHLDCVETSAGEAVDSITGDFDVPKDLQHL